MSSVTQGNSVTFTIPANRTIEVTTAGEAVIRNTDEFASWRALSDAPVRKTFSSVPRRITITAVSGTATYTVFHTDVIPFTGNRTLSLDDNGKVLRCDDTSNVTITVPATLPECFTCGFLMWSTGTVTVAAGSGATKRSGVSAISAQYSGGALLVVKNANDASAEFVLSGGFS